MAQGNHVLKALELVADQHGDPTDQVYAAMFECYPEAEELFVLDTDGAVRGTMLQHVFDCIFDHFDDNNIAPGFINSSRYLHDCYGVPPEQFDHFFELLRATIAGLLGPQWTADMDHEWRAMNKAFTSPAQG